MKMILMIIALVLVTMTGSSQTKPAAKSPGNSIETVYYPYSIGLSGSSGRFYIFSLKNHPTKKDTQDVYQKNRIIEKNKR